MKKSILFIFLMIFTGLALQAQLTDLWIQDANQQYSDGKYQDAIEKYEAIIAEGYLGCELFFNLGNAYYKSGKIAPAILNYERALQLNPSDEDVLYNLELANRMVVDKIEPLPEFFIKKWIGNVGIMLDTDVWAITSMVAFIVFLLLLSLFLYSRSVGFKKLVFWFSLLLLVVSVLSFFSSKRQLKRIVSDEYAIVFTPSVTVKSSPNQDGTDLFVIHEGTKVQISESDRDWSEIKLTDGSKGWLKSIDIVPI